MVKEIETHIQKAQRVPKEGHNDAHTKTHHNYNGKVKDKERIIKAARERQLVTCKEVPIRLLAYFSTETFQTRRDWQEIFKVMESGELLPRL